MKPVVFPPGRARFPTKPAPFEYQGFSDDNLVDFTPEIRAMAKKAVEGYRMGPLYTPPSLGTPTNLASQKYLNGKKVPQLYVSAGATRFNDPKNFPWTVPWYTRF